MSSRAGRMSPVPQSAPARRSDGESALSFAAMAGRSRFSMSPRSMIDVAALEHVVSGVSRTDIQQARNRDLLRSAVRLADIVAVSRAVSDTAGRLEKIAHLAELLKRAQSGDIAMVITFLSGEARQGRMGIGGALLSAMRDVPPADLGDVDAAFDRIAEASGAGSTASRAQLLRQLLGRATRDEQDFLIRLLFGELRQGALEGVLMDAVARASGIAATRIRRAAMLAGDLAPVARTAIVDGDRALSQFILRPFQPVQPMLADSAAGVGEALATLGEASFEYKLDGARIQVHKVGDEVKV